MNQGICRPKERWSSALAAGAEVESKAPKSGITLASPRRLVPLTVFQSIPALHGANSSAYPALYIIQ